VFTIEIILKDNPLPISVQRKEAETAEALYQQILTAMRSPASELVELTCDKQEEKKIAVFSDRINAVVMDKKSGGTAEGRVPGFFATVEV
jgi:hypothetical protein